MGAELKQKESVERGWQPCVLEGLDSASTEHRTAQTTFLEEVLLQATANTLSHNTVHPAQAPASNSGPAKNGVDGVDNTDRWLGKSGTPHYPLT